MVDLVEVEQEEVAVDVLVAGANPEVAEKDVEDAHVEVVAETKDVPER